MKIVDSCFEIHKTLGSGLLEYVYKEKSIERNLGLLVNFKVELTLK
jgi:hypothetical protein